MTSLVELLRWRARTQPERVSHTFLIPAGAGAEREWETLSLTYAELDERVRAVAALLQSEGATGKRALLFCPPGLDYVVAFFGCLFARVIAVPAYPPRANRNIARLEAIATNAQADFALSTTSIVERAHTSSAIPELKHLRWLPVDGLPLNTATEWRETSPRGDDLAYLQYTSGSTAAPKGVMISHDNVLHNSAYIHYGFAHSQDSVSLSWLPHFHDMGLLDGIIQPLFGGFHGLLMSPAAFLQSPLDWLAAITSYGVTHSGGPNFAYELCARRQSTRPREDLDLSKWTVAYNGAEPVRADTLEHFAAAFGQYGFRWESFYPAYGLAEATLKVSGGRKGLAPIVLGIDTDALAKNRVALSSTNVLSLVGVGSAGMDTQVRIVNPDTAHPCRPDEVGEIWVSGPGVARGYWRDEAETEKTFGARLAGTDEGPFLRTGDLGFFHDGELFVTGRIKDLIIVRGRNLYPQDLERTAELSHPSLRPGGGAVFSIEVKGEERLVVVHEVDNRQPPDTGEVVARVREHVALEHEESVHAVVLIKHGSLPKTSSGKVQRRACRALFLEGRLDVVGEWRESEPVEIDSVPDSNNVEEWIADQIGARIGVPARQLDREMPLTRLGLDSLSATELVHAVELRFGVTVSLSRLLDEATVNSLAAAIAAGHGPESATEISAVVDTEYPLSRGQEALWFLQQLAPESEAYYIVRALRINGSITVPLFKQAWQRLVERHAVLRTTFAAAKGSPVQHVAASADVFFRHEEAAGYDEEELRCRLDQVAHELFNLEAGPLLRVTLFTLRANEHVLLLAIHHIISDFRSLTVLLEEFAMIYQALLNDREPDLSPLSSSYLDYVKYEQEWLRGDEAERQRQYWTNALGDTLPLLNLVSDRPRPLTKTYRGASLNFSLSPELSRALKELAQSEGVTLYMLMLASFQLLLHRYSGQEEILVGSATSGRRSARFADVPGYFVNPVVLRQRFDVNATFATFIASVRRTVLSAFAHQDYPFHELVERLHPQRDPGRNPLFDVMFNWYGGYSTTSEGFDAFALGHAGVRSDLGGLAVESVALPSRVAQFDLTLNMAETARGLRGVLEYSSELFEEQTAERMLGHLQRLLEGVVAEPEGRIWELPLLSAAEQDEVLEGFNQTERAYRRGVCLHELFAEQVKRTPAAVAVVYGAQRLSYAELDARAEAWAERLRRRGIGPESRVGVMLERSPELVMALLAVLKAGGAYVPLDARYPSERLAFMLADGEVEVVLTQSELLETLPATTAQVLCLDQEEELAGESVANGAVGAENLAYVIYTSGSTGRPKGVAITHASAGVLVQWAQETFTREELAAVLFSTSVCFDLSVFELFVPLCSGGAVVVAEDALALPALAAREQVTLVNTVPSAMAELVRGGRLPQSVMAVALAGEPLSRELVEGVYRASETRRVLNLYGPTEDTTYSTWAEVGRASERVTIGRPVANTRAYILDRELRPVPVGVAGELYLGGAGLARGYLKRPALTAERFVPDPYAGVAGARLYRTGDLARYLGGGEIEYLGRMDQQVKVRGYRIELGEVEAALAVQPGVRECCVTVSTNGGEAGARLVAYVVREAGTAVGAGELRAQLRARLPEFMVPATVVFLEALPLTPNGKLDRKALPEAEVSGTEDAYVGPRTTAEELVAGVWEELLGVARVGVADNFFELGGHSLLATRVSARLREVFGVELGVRTLFEAPTVAELARRLGESGELALPPLVAEARGERTPLSFAQRRLWFLQRLEPESGSYNVAGAVRLQGELDAVALERALAEVVRRHEVLRARISEEGGEPWQEIEEDWREGLQTADLSAVADAGEREALAQARAEAVARRPFNLAEGGLLRAMLLRLSPQEHLLVLVLHHIVCDGWSLGVLLREMGQLYTAYTHAASSPLEPLQVQYADYAHWQRRWLQGATLEFQLNYWRQRLANAPPALPLPTDRPRPAMQSSRGAQHTLLLPSFLRDGLRQTARSGNATLFMVLLGAFQVLLHRYTREDDILVGSPIAGRTHEEIEKLIGFFVNTIVLRTNLSGNPTFEQLLEQVRETCLGAYAHQDVPFEKLLEELQPERNLRHSPLFQVMFILQNEAFESFEWPGLKLRPTALESVTAKFDLTLSMTELADGLSATLEYNTDLFDADTAQRMLEHLRVLLEGIVTDPSRRVSELPLLTADEQRQLVTKWSGPARAETEELCLHELFERQAARTPDAIAVISGDRRLSYEELNARANVLSHELRKHGVGPDVPVALFADRSITMLVALLGILKAGGAYVPLDVASPSIRLDFMLQETGAPVIVTQEHLLHLLPEHDAIIVCPSDDSWSTRAESRLEPVVGPVTSSNLAYIIFTSGSTGRPKGVQIEHRAVVNFLTSMQQQPGIAADDVLLAVTTLSFDIALLELMLPLTAGACVALVDRETASDGAALSRKLAQAGATLMQATPATWRLLLQAGWKPKNDFKILCGGEAWGRDLATPLLTPGSAVWNMYGPTETTIWSTVAEVKQGDNSIPLGRPIRNTEVYVLDAEMWLVPIGIAGEVYIGGDGLARGYLNRPELTAERFVPNPFGDKPGARLYRTGDLARYLASGEIEYLGRMDQQLKVRGYRIEPGEIEARLCEHDSVREAVVVAREDASGEKRLVAYVVARYAPLAATTQLRTYLQERLPDYMVPSIFVVLDALPLNSNGKVDRRALPAPDTIHGDPESTYVAPRTPVEELLCGIWEGLLGVAKVGVEDNFFHLGGHSLLVTRLTARVREVLNVELALRDVFEFPTVGELARRLEQVRAVTEGGSASAPVIRTLDSGVGVRRPLSYAQRRLWFLQRLEPESAAYNLAGAVRLKGELDAVALECALSEVTRRHEVLRARFVEDDGEPWQMAVEPVPLTLVVEDLSSGEVAEDEARRVVEQESRRPFDLTTEPMLRVRLLRLSELDHVLVMVIHHIACDGWSLGILIAELNALYNSKVKDQSSPLLELPLQYADYAEWQLQWLAGEELERQISYWREQLAGAPPALELPTIRPRPVSPSDRGSVAGARLAPGLVNALHELAHRYDCTLFMVVTAAWQFLLSSYSGQTDVCIGTPVWGRPRRELDGLIGFFINTLVLRTDLSGDPTFSTLLGRVRETCIGAYAHQDAPFERLVEELAPARELGRSPFFQSMVAMQGATIEGLQLNGLEAEAMRCDTGTAKFELTLMLAEDLGGGLETAIEYSSDLFEAATIARMLGHFETLLKAAVADPEQKISRLPLLTERELQQLVFEWNETRREYPSEQCIHELFEAQAVRSPEHVAVQADEEQLTYAELDQRANQLAHYLREQGVGPGTLVGICMGRAPEMFVSVLAVLKAGAAFVPMDPSYPLQRLAWMLEDCGIWLLLTQERLATELRTCAVNVFCVDTEWEQQVAWRSRESAQVRATAEQPAYVIYTSGSTGQPKGILLRHRGLCNLIVASNEMFEVSGASRVLQFSSFGFDVSVWETFMSLTAGATLCLSGQNTNFSMVELRERLQREEITVALLPPSVLRLLAAEDLPRLRTLIAVGEKCTAENVGRWAGGRKFFNGYGPAEATVTVSAHLTSLAENYPQGPPIGGPFPNTEFYILDRNLQAVPVGVAGELCVGGVQLALGYVNRPALTAEKFVPHPFSREAGARLYRTGDLARYLADGNVEYVGRIDQQVKLRGYRIEPGEIAAVLESHEAVSEAVVLLREEEGGDKRLVAYLVAAPGQEPPASTLRAYLKERLPDYMVPAVFVFLDALPLTPNGKVDRKALPAPDLTRSVGDADYVAPRSLEEELIAGIWSELLGVGPVGIKDNFFELGGHSLLATRVMSRLTRSLGVELRLRALFESPTVESMAQIIAKTQQQQTAPPLEKISHEQPPLSFAQQRLWFLDQLEPESALYNIPSAVRLTGPLSVTALQQSFNEIARRHESLRTSFRTIDGQPVQIISEPVALPICVVDLKDVGEAERKARMDQLLEEEAQRPFDLAQGPLIRCALLQLGQEENVLSVVMHHIISDGGSISILIDELQTLYEAYTGGRESVALPELPVQYADYAHWQRRWLQGEALETELGYWRDRLAGASPSLDLPTDHPRSQLRSTRGGIQELKVDSDLVASLRTLARNHDCTLFMVLMAVWQLLLSRYSGQTDVSVGTPVAGRIQPELERLIGFFVNTLVIRTDFSEVQTFAKLLERVREACLGAYQHQSIPFEKVVEELAPERSLGRTPLFQVMLVLQSDVQGLRLTGVDAEEIYVGGQTAKFDLTLTFGEEQDGGLRGVLEYSSELFEEQTVARMLGHLQRLLEGVVAEPEGRIRELPLLSAAEQDEVLEGFNETERAYRHGVCLHELFAEQVKRTPAAVAVMCGAQRLSYAELDARAEELAERLRRRGVGPESRVGVMLERSPELVMALLAVLKAGGAYVPLDARYPRERLAFMLADAEAEVVLTQSELLETLPATTAQVLCLDKEEELAGESVANGAVGAENLAYVIYTSGSTGQPKGVAITHANACVLVQWAQETFTREELAAVLFATSVCFDLSVFELFVPLCSGGAVVMAEDALVLPALAAREQVTLVNTVPSAMAELVRGGRLPQSVMAVALAGEPLSRELVEGVYRASETRRVLNLYGPTEDTTYSTWAEVARVSERVTIGRPVANTRAYILDRELRPVPVGVAGELYLGGAGLARGYLKRPALTAERFVPDPYSGVAGARLYRTGDLARYLGGGEIEYLGRMDQQVKVRGYRIELGEVEAALAMQPGVRECCVAVSTNGAEAGARLVAYVVREAGTAVGAGELRAQLRARLPEFMVPATVMFLEALPLTPNGKLDRKALPAAEVSGTEDAYVGPRTTAEELVAGVWEELLGVARVGVADNFFELGGHSLLATRVSARLREVFGVELGVRTLFEAPTVAELARRLGESGEAALPPLVAEARGERTPLSFAQRRLWFLQRLEPESGSYNVAGAVRLQGELDAVALERALAEVVRRHEVLRARISEEGGEPWQEIEEDWREGLQTADLSAVADAGEREALAQARAEAVARRPFNLAEGGLLRAMLLRLSSQEHLLVLVLHHIVCDGWSLGVLLREMGQLYTAYTHAAPSPLEPLQVQYADYAHWQRRWLQGKTLAAQLNYWRQRLANATPQMLPMAGFGNSGRRFVAANYKLEFPLMLTNDLRALSRRESVTLYMLLLAAFQTLLHSYTRQEDIVIGTAVANRHVPGVEQLIGFFVNTLAVRTDLGGNPRFRELLQRVRELTLEAYEHQDLPYETLVEELRHERKTEDLTLFRAYFNLLNFEDQLRLPGLEASYVAMETVPTKFDLTLSVTDTGRELTGLLGYNSALFSASQIENLGRQFITLLENVIADPGQKIAAVLPSSREQQAQIINDFNDEFEINSIGV